MKLFQPLEQSIFQPLETEMKPVLPYLTGRVLNAGCGERDISRLLTAHHAASVDNCDIQSSIPSAIRCDLSAVPRPGCYYDSIFNNAVLEHVVDCDAVMAEFSRLLRRGGHLVLGVPFLQPFHPCPGDYRRFTSAGLIELGRRHGFEAVQVFPVHSMAQTITWILWAILQEKRMRLTRGLLKLPLLLWCTLSSRTDPALRMNANTFQIVLRKVA